MKIKELVNKTLIGMLSVAVLSSNCDLIMAKAEETLETLQDSQNFLQEEENRLENVLADLRDNDAKREEYVETLEKQIDVFFQQMDVQDKRVALLNDEIKKKEVSIEIMQKRIKEHLEKAKQRLRAIFKAGGDVSLILAILNTDNLKDFIDTAQAAQVVGKHDTKLIQSLNQEMISLENEKVKIEENKKEIESLKSSLESKCDQVQKIKDDNKKILEERREKELLEAKRRAEQCESRSVEFKSSNTSKNGRYILPVDSGFFITAHWGDGRGHTGIDLSRSGAEGAGIYAAASGTVVDVNSSNSWGSGYGYYVKISHGSGYETLYAHCSAVCVSAGQAVEQGQLIARVGNTGHSTGPHLHFETRKDGRPYNPECEV